VVPAGASALGLIAALDPVGVVDDLTANTLLLLLVIVLWLRFGDLFDTFGLFSWLFAFAILIDVLFFKVIKNISLKIEGVEESSFG
jgi:hypothetical protein